MATLSDPVETGEGIADRLRAATVAWRDAREVAERTAERWRGLVVEAIDAGVPQQTVAELARVSRSRVHAIVAREYAR